jgi:hypothetical protein
MYTHIIRANPNSILTFITRFKIIVLVYPTFCDTYRTNAASAERIKDIPKPVITSTIDVVSVKNPAIIGAGGKETAENCRDNI